MFRVLIADDNHEDRELLKLEIERALASEQPQLHFFEAVSVGKAVDILNAQPIDLLTLDIEFDRLNEGVMALPELFEQFPALSIIVISGKLNKAEVAEELFKFTKDNILKGKRWVRHFDVLDKKDDKSDSLWRAYKFVIGSRDSADKLKELFLLAEGHLDKGDMQKCLATYEKIQALAPGEQESSENLALFKGEGFEKAIEHLRKGDKLVAALLLGHHIEMKLKAFTRRTVGRSHQSLSECLKEVEQARRISPFRRRHFHAAMRIRNKAIHQPAHISELDFESARKTLTLLEGDY